MTLNSESRLQSSLSCLFNELLIQKRWIKGRRYIFVPSSALAGEISKVVNEKDTVFLWNTLYMCIAYSWFYLAASRRYDRKANIILLGRAWLQYVLCWPADRQKDSTYVLGVKRPLQVTFLTVNTLCSGIVARLEGWENIRHSEYDGLYISINEPQLQRVHLSL